MLGDANGDGIVNSKDILIIKMFLNDEVFIDKKAAEINGDGTVDAKDIEIISGNVAVAVHECTWNEWTMIKGATCTTEGEKRGYCVCGKTQIQNIPVIGHEYVDNICTHCGSIDLEPTEGLEYVDIGRSYSVAGIGTAIGYCGKYYDTGWQKLCGCFKIPCDCSAETG